MIRFLIGFLAVHVAVVVVAWRHLVFLYAGADQTAALVGGLLIVPALAAWIALESASLAGRRRLLDWSAPRRWRAVVVGGLTALPSLVAATVLIAFLDEYVTEPLLCGGAALLSAGIVAWCLPRVRRGCCPTCGYDLRAVLGSGRCPECGGGRLTA